jgi:hypothetical protein
MKVRGRGIAQTMRIYASFWPQVSFFLCSLFFFIQLTSIFIIYDEQGGTRELTASIPQENSHGKDEGNERGGGSSKRREEGNETKGRGTKLG